MWFVFKNIVLTAIIDITIVMMQLTKIGATKIFILIFFLKLNADNRNIDPILEGNWLYGIHTRLYLIKLIIFDEMRLDKIYFRKTKNKRLICRRLSCNWPWKQRRFSQSVIVEIQCFVFWFLLSLPRPAS